MQRVPRTGPFAFSAPQANLHRQAATRGECLPKQKHVEIAKQERFPKHRELCIATLARQGRLEKDNHIAAFATQANLSIRSERIVRTALEGDLLLRVLTIAQIV